MFTIQCICKNCVVTHVKQFVARKKELHLVAFEKNASTKYHKSTIQFISFETQQNEISFFAWIFFVFWINVFITYHDIFLTNLMLCIFVLIKLHWKKRICSMDTVLWLSIQRSCFLSSPSKAIALWDTFYYIHSSPNIGFSISIWS